MKEDDDREWFEGNDEGSFAQAARNAVENAEREFERRGERFPTEYDVALRVRAHGPLSDYRVYVSPTG
jgi:hypothetical protein